MYALIQSVGELGGYIDRYGLPLVGLIAFAWLGYLIVWKVLIPRLDKRDEMAQQQNERMLQMMESQLTEARDARSQEVGKFVKVVDDTITNNTDSLRKVSETLNGLVTEVRKKREPRPQ